MTSLYGTENAGGGRLTLLEEGDPEALQGCEPLTICSGAEDLAVVFSDHDSTVKTTREQAIAYARLFVAAPALVEALRQMLADAEQYGYQEVATDHPMVRGVPLARAALKAAGVA